MNFTIAYFKVVVVQSIPILVKFHTFILDCTFWLFHVVSCFHARDFNG